MRRTVVAYPPRPEHATAVGIGCGILETALLATVSTITHKDGLISTDPVGFDWDGGYVRLSTLKSRVKYRA
jgi:hypothetical protein